MRYLEPSSTYQQQVKERSINVSDHKDLFSPSSRASLDSLSDARWVYVVVLVVWVDLIVDVVLAGGEARARNDLSIWVSH